MPGDCDNITFLDGFDDCGKGILAFGNANGRFHYKTGSFFSCEVKLGPGVLISAILRCNSIAEHLGGQWVSPVCDRYEASAQISFHAKALATVTLVLGQNGGGGWIRTNGVVRREIYSLRSGHCSTPPREPQKEPRAICPVKAHFGAATPPQVRTRASGHLSIARRHIRQRFATAMNPDSLIPTE